MPLMTEEASLKVRVLRGGDAAEAKRIVLGLIPD